MNIMMGSKVLIFSLALLVSGSIVAAQYTDPYCFIGDLCDFDPPACATAAGSCGATTCLDAVNFPEDCLEPDNFCFGKYCDSKVGEETAFCGPVTEDCVALTCTNLQAEMCPDTVADGVCNEDGSSSCPAPMTCEIRSNGFSYACDSGSAASSVSLVAVAGLATASLIALMTN
jgi:hypothetical protein